MISEEIKAKYEAVIGLEIHAQMLTKSKAYSSDANEYGSRPNTNLSVVTLAHPGTLPLMNKQTIEYAIRLGIATNCKIANYQNFDRKNYFYPDLPKSYQISQNETPICANGKVEVKMPDGSIKAIGITRIHMEEDTGKSLHDVDVYDTLIDLNRAGTPLLEIVTEPDLRSGDEAYAYLTEMRQLVRYLDISDGNMEEGNMRCDANVSIRLKGAKEFGRRVEVKNMNSIRNVQRAINHEIERHIELVENGEIVPQETRNFDAATGKTVKMREKEDSVDYLLFPEPDLQPIFVSEDHIAAVKAEMPTLPKELYRKYTEELGLSDYDANNIISTKPIALYFEELINYTKNYKAASNWLNGDVRSYLNNRGIGIEEFPVSAAKLADLIEQIDAGLVSVSAASQHIFPVMVERPETSAKEIAEELNLIQDSDEDSLADLIRGVIKQHTAEVERYKVGEKQLTGFFMGQVMKASGGKADPKATSQLLRKLLEE